MNTHRFLLTVVAAFAALLMTTDLQAQTQRASVWTVPEIGALPRDGKGNQIREGRDLITATYAYIGPNVADASKRYAGNNLACTNCHLSAGTKKFALPLFGLHDQFPQYSARSAATITIEDRINSCMTRSMNGKLLPVDSPEMRAFVAYIDFLSSGVPAGEILPGAGAGKMPELKGAASPDRGRAVYTRSCAACHNTDGSGIPRDRGAPALGYMMPPVWGPGSYNNGAGLARLIDLANFVHFNMPHGADYLNPQLSVREAWDVAAFVLSQPRPQRAALDKDFPDLLTKPVDTPYGPYADSFSEQQHKYGPWGPIREAIARLKRAR